MGYDLHVFRGDEWFEAEPIPFDEWAEFVESSNDLRATGSVEATTPAGETIRMEDDGLAEWAGHGKAPVPVLFSDGQLVVKNPDDETIAWLVSVADRLGARVQGDDGEFYPAAGDSGPAPGEPRQGWFRRRRRGRS
jgi:hypothetical protein